MPAPYVIAEIGCNHGGDLELAKRMISVAARFCEVDAVKFQKRDPATLLTPEQYQAPHPEPRNAFGASYGEHREFLEFDIEQHAELARCAAEHGVVYSTSVWDMPSAKAVVGDGAEVRQGARRPPTSTPSCWSCCAPSSAASSTSRSA